MTLWWLWCRCYINKNFFFWCRHLSHSNTFVHPNVLFIYLSCRLTEELSPFSTKLLEFGVHHCYFECFLYSFTPVIRKKVLKCWKTEKSKFYLQKQAAVTLLLVGTGLVVMGAYCIADPQNGSQGAVFLVAGFICFIPGAYHVVYIWLAARGHRGFDFYHLPLFT